MAASGVPEARWKWADLIVERFSQAGFSKREQLAAILANAILESGLDPTIKAAGSEQSFGLFQCNRTHGLGKGFSIEQLKDPEVNIRIIITECKKLPAFAAVTTVEKAVEIFVLDIERPLDKPAAIAKRTTMARRLLEP